MSGPTNPAPRTVPAGPPARPGRWLWLALACWGLGTARPLMLGLHADGRDYATFHYAARAWRQGADPYDPGALSALAQADKTRDQVYPFFYPPPSLPLFAWTLPVDLGTGHRIMVAINQLALLGVGAALWRWFRAPLPVLALLAIGYGPIVQNARLGQLNAVLLCMIVVGLAAGRSAGIAAAAMIKMSPALLLARWVALPAWRPLAAAAAVALGVSVASLPMVPLDLHLDFYTRVLPQFATGQYNGLQVPIDLPANHSFANLFDQIWPGPDPHTLSAPAAWSARLTAGAGLLAVVWSGRRPLDKLGEAGLFGALTTLMVLSPVFAYEHHLLFLLLPLTVVFTALARGRLPRWSWIPAVAAALALAVPIEQFRAWQAAAPGFGWWIRESKLAGAVATGVLSLWTARRPG